MDQVLGYLINRMKEEQIFDKINIIIVSDHGMAQMETKSIILVSQYVKNYTSVINSSKTIYGIVSNIYPVNETMVNMF